MHAPPLRRRLVLSGVMVLTVVLLLFDVFVYASLRGGLEESLGELLDARLAVVTNLADELDPEALADRMAALAIPGSVETPDGMVFISDPSTPRLGSASPPTALPEPTVSRRVELTGGTVVTVLATRAGVDSTLRRLVTILSLGTLLAVAVTGLLWRRTSTDLLAPLAHMAETAERITAGEAGRRLEPDRSHTELGRVATAFDAMVDAQVAAVRTAEAERERTRRFLADAAHQMRTPMAGVRASAEQLLQERHPETRDRLLANVVRETSRASRLVTALLRMERLEHETATREPTDVVALCNQEVERARSLAPHLAIDLVADSAPGSLLLNPDAIREALANLMDNARRHARTAVRLEASGDEEDVLLRVVDDGPGVPAEDADRIFDRFTSLDGKGGSGLGLPIARAVARAHGGDLAYESGAFTMRLPAVPADRPPGRSETSG